MNIELDREDLEIICQSLDMNYEMLNDMCLEDVWVGHETTAITRIELMEMRDKADKAVSRLLKVHALKLRLEAI